MDGADGGATAHPASAPPPIPLSLLPLISPVQVPDQQLQGSEHQAVGPEALPGVRQAGAGVCGEARHPQLQMGLQVCYLVSVWGSKSPGGAGA